MKHGHSSNGKLSPAYISWRQMLARCRATEGPRFKYYGARGISYCERWESFKNFLADMGERPAGTLLDRRDNEASYEPGNCRWATRSEQMRNRRRISYTHCRRGHEFKPETTVYRRSGARQCRICVNMKQAERRQATYHQSIR